MSFNSLMKIKIGHKFLKSIVLASLFDTKNKTIVQQKIRKIQSSLEMPWKMLKENSQHYAGACDEASSKFFDFLQNPNIFQEIMELVQNNFTQVNKSKLEAEFKSAFEFFDESDETNSKTEHEVFEAISEIKDKSIKTRSENRHESTAKKSANHDLLNEHQNVVEAESHFNTDNAKKYLTVLLWSLKTRPETQTLFENSSPKINATDIAFLLTCLDWKRPDTLSDFSFWQSIEPQKQSFANETKEHPEFEYEKDFVYKHGFDEELQDKSDDKILKEIEHIYFYESELYSYDTDRYTDDYDGFEYFDEAKHDSGEVLNAGTIMTCNKWIGFTIHKLHELKENGKLGLMFDLFFDDILYSEILYFSNKRNDSFNREKDSIDGSIINSTTHSQKEKNHLHARNNMLEEELDSSPYKTNDFFDEKELNRFVEPVGVPNKLYLFLRFFAEVELNITIAEVAHSIKEYLQKSYMALNNKETERVDNSRDYKDIEVGSYHNDSSNEINELLDGSSADSKLIMIKLIACKVEF